MSLSPMQQELALRKATKMMGSSVGLFNAARLEFNSMLLIGNTEGMDAARQKCHDSLDLILDAECSLYSINNMLNGG